MSIAIYADRSRHSNDIDLTPCVETSPVLIDMVDHGSTGMNPVRGLWFKLIPGSLKYHTFRRRQHMSPLRGL